MPDCSVTESPVAVAIVKGRDTKNTTSVIVTHRHQDGQLLANFRYNPESGRLERFADSGGGTGPRTLFMVFGEGRLVFEGTQEELERSTDPYISKFKTVKP